jgi:hypothetical protein
MLYHTFVFVSASAGINYVSFYNNGARYGRAHICDIPLTITLHRIGSGTCAIEVPKLKVQKTLDETGTSAHIPGRNKCEQISSCITRTTYTEKKTYEQCLPTKTWGLHRRWRWWRHLGFEVGESRSQVIIARHQSVPLS